MAKKHRKQPDSRQDAQQDIQVQQAASEEEKDRRHFIIKLLAVLLIILLLLLTIIWQCGKDRPAVGPENTETTQGPETTVKQIEISAEDISENNTEGKLSQPEGGGSVRISYSNKVTISRETGKITMNFQNPGRSNQDIALEILVNGHSIAESGRIQPGKQLKTMQLKDNISMGKGGHKGIFKLTYYDTETGKAAMVDTDININIVVED